MPDPEAQRHLLHSADAAALQEGLRFLLVIPTLYMCMYAEYRLKKKSEKGEKDITVPGIHAVLLSSTLTLKCLIVYLCSYF